MVNNRPGHFAFTRAAAASKWPGTAAREPIIVAAARSGHHGSLAGWERWGPGVFDNDDALGPLGTLARQDAAGRRETLQWILCRIPDSLEDASWRKGHV